MFEVGVGFKVGWSRRSSNRSGKSGSLTFCFSVAVPSARRDLLLGDWTAGSTTAVVSW